MTEGWRNRYMAPVYALMVTFGLVFLLGAALNDAKARTPEPPGPSQPPATGASTKIQFQPVESTARIAELDGSAVELFGEDHQTTKVDANGALLLSTLKGPYVLCAKLPAGWSAPGRVRSQDSALTCWVLREPTQKITLPVTKQL